jgi:hypothetical protein
MNDFIEKMKEVDVSLILHKVLMGALCLFGGFMVIGAIFVLITVMVQEWGIYTLLIFPFLVAAYHVGHYLYESDINKNR